MEILDHSHHLLTGVGGCVEVQKVVAALECSFKQRTGIAADEAGHVVLADVQRTGVGCAQANAEGVAAVEQNLGNIVAGVAHRDLALGLCFCDKLVICLFQKLLKKSDVFQVFHCFPPYIHELMRAGPLSVLTGILPPMRR